MPIRFQCPKCHVRLSVTKRKAGQASPCPNCRQQITIPLDATTDAPPPLPAHRSESKATAATLGKAVPVIASTPTIAASGEAPDSAPIKQSRPAVTKAFDENVHSHEPLMGQRAINSELVEGSAYRTKDVQGNELAAEIERLAEREKFISFPRWLVYFQAGLLGVVAATFFLLGMMINQNSGDGEVRTTEMYDCQLTGHVMVKADGKKVPDQGAVVLVLPVNGHLSELDLQPLRPDQFEPLNNLSISAIEAIGGRVVRIDQNGEFDLSLRGPRSYVVLVVSRLGIRPEDVKIPKFATGQLKDYFFLGDLVGNKKYSVSPILLKRRSQNLATIEF